MSGSAAVALRVDLPAGGGSPGGDAEAPGAGRPGAASSLVDSRAQTVQQLQERIRGMQRTRLDSRALPTHDAFEGLLPGGALEAGSSYAVAGSTSLALALLQGPSAAGSWCAVIGMPGLGIEAAAGMGIDLERLVLVPHPGEHWATVTSALIDVVSVVLVAPPAPGTGPRLSPALAQKFSSRLRTREGALVAMGRWPEARASLRVTRSDWAGLGSGFGHLQGRQVTVASASSAWGGRERGRRLWLPGPDGRISVVEPRSDVARQGAEVAAQAAGVSTLAGV